MGLVQFEVSLHILLYFESHSLCFSRLLGEGFGLVFVCFIHIGAHKIFKYLQLVINNACLFVQLEGRSGRFGIHRLEGGGNLSLRPPEGTELLSDPCINVGIAVLVHIVRIHHIQHGPGFHHCSSCFCTRTFQQLCPKHCSLFNSSSFQSDAVSTRNGEPLEIEETHFLRVDERLEINLGIQLLCDLYLLLVGDDHILFLQFLHIGQVPLVLKRTPSHPGQHLPNWKRRCVREGADRLLLLPHQLSAWRA